MSDIEQMPYIDYLKYAEYKRRKGLPFERLELLLARLAYIMAGNPKAKIQDFILPEHFDAEPEQAFNLGDLDYSKLKTAKINFDLFKNKRIKK